MIFVGGQTLKAFFKNTYSENIVTLLHIRLKWRNQVTCEGILTLSKKFGYAFIP